MYKNSDEELKKMDQGLANKYIKYNSFEFTDDDSLKVAKTIIGQIRLEIEAKLSV